MLEDVIEINCIIHNAGTQYIIHTADARYICISTLHQNCNTLKHSATHCNTLLTHDADAQCMTRTAYAWYVRISAHYIQLQHTATHCNTLLAVCCSVLQCVAVCWYHYTPCISSACYILYILTSVLLIHDIYLYNRYIYLYNTHILYDACYILYTLTSVLLKHDIYMTSITYTYCIIPIHLYNTHILYNTHC